MPPPSLHPDECTSAAPNISPGLVGNEELLLREVYSPHVENGKLIKRAIPIDELAQGLSVHRMKYTTADFVKDSIQKRLSRPRMGEPWKDEGVAMLKAEEVREICWENEQGENERAFTVRDTARSDHRGHASIHVAGPRKKDEYMRELRSYLLKRLEKRMSVDEAFKRL